MLEGIEEPSADEGLLRKWRKEKQQLEDRVSDLEWQLDAEKHRAARLLAAINALRGYLTPQYRALRILFGEIEAVAGDEADGVTPTASNTQTNTTNPRWQSFKDTFPGVPARIIDALLTHQEMSITQLSALLKAHYNTVADALSRLAKAGAVQRDGGKNGKYRLST
jgi:hypothetical protein